MKIVFMGTPPFAAHLLDVLINKGYEIGAVFTKPDTPQGRGKKLGASAVKTLALEHNLPIFQPDKMTDSEVEAFIESYQPDFLVVAAYGKILPKKLLDWARIAPVNVHASILPAYRGAAPIQWAVRNGDKETGVSIMKMEEGLDSGGVYHISRIPLSEDETTGTLFDKLAVLSGDVLPDILEKIEAKSLIAMPQEEAKVTYAPMFSKADEKIDWTKSAKEVKNLIHSLAPSPGAYSLLDDVRIKFYQAEVVSSQGEAGRIIAIEKHSFIVACGEDSLRFKEVQPSGKKLMPVHAFLNGNEVSNQSRFD